ncbi:MULTISPECIES: YybH family protein [Novilysobacter]|uniref:YybH family protein n=1 Tax=Novilysobacter TaxID=3382699 RepID=UPI002FC70571
MKTAISMLSAALLLGMALPVPAQTQPSSSDHAHPAAASTAAMDVPAAAQAPVEVVDAFGKALVAGDFAEVETLLDPSVIILESGGAERSRSEYLSHHARSDAKFLSGTHSTLTHRRARVDGDTAWIASESELHASRDGKPMTLLSTETVVLNNTPEGWRIVHIHWSSRPKKS